MSIEQPQKHPQVQAFRDAAILMRAVRYFPADDAEAQIDALDALCEVLTEIEYHLGQHRVLDPLAMEAYRRASRISLPAAIERLRQIRGDA